MAKQKQAKQQFVAFSDSDGAVVSFDLYFRISWIIKLTTTSNTINIQSSITTKQLER
jgi:hypothetical protein